MPPVIIFLSEKLYVFSCHPLAWSLLSGWGLVTVLSGGWSADVRTMCKEFSPKDIVPPYSSAPPGDEEQRLSRAPLPGSLGGAGLYIQPWRDTFVQTINFATGLNGWSFKAFKTALLLKHKCAGEHCTPPCGAGGTALQAARGGELVARAVSHRIGVEVTGMAVALLWDSRAPPSFACSSSIRPRPHCGAVSGMLHLQPSFAPAAGQSGREGGWAPWWVVAVPEEDCSGSAMWPWLWSPEIYFESIYFVSVTLSKILYHALWRVHRWKNIFFLMSLSLTVLEIKPSYNVLWKCES